MPGGLEKIGGPPQGTEHRPAVPCPECGLGLIRVGWTTRMTNGAETRIRTTFAWRCDWCRAFYRGHPDRS